MDEDAHVTDQLDRIDALRRAGAAPRSILSELRGLLRAGEAATGGARPAWADRDRARPDGVDSSRTRGEVAGGAG
jgi:hypothetical protein